MVKYTKIVRTKGVILWVVAVAEEPVAVLLAAVAEALAEAEAEVLVADQAEADQVEGAVRLEEVPLAVAGAQEQVAQEAFMEDLQ